MPWWALTSSIAAPVLLITGGAIAQLLQPKTYSPVHNSISGLARLNATDRWLMTAVFVAVGLCFAITAIGLRPAHPAGLICLIGGGIATLLVAAFPQPIHGASEAHAVAATVTLVTLAIWPLCAMRRNGEVPLLTSTGAIPAEVVIVALAAWLAIDRHGALLGIAERLAAAAEAVWPFAVSASAWRALGHRVEQTTAVNERTPLSLGAE